MSRGRELASTIGRLVACALSLVLSLGARSASAAPLRVVVPDRENLQYMSFWVASGGGFFAREGVDIEIVTPPGPQQTSSVLERREAEAAVLPPPLFLNAIASGAPLVLVANLLRHDPIDLVVRPEIAADRRLSGEGPLRARLESMRGLRVGVAPHPPSRLRALFASVGMDADRDVTMVILRGPEQNPAFASKQVDALYAHTPFLERAIVHDGAVIVVDQARGEVPAVSQAQIHGFVVHRAVLEARRDVVAAAVRAIARAQESVHASAAETVDVLARKFPERDRRELETIVRLYQPAVPDSPEVRAEAVAAGLDLFPAGMKKPDLSGIDLRAHVAPELAAEAARARSSTDRAWLVVAGVAAAVVLAVVIAALGARRRAS